MQSSQTKNYAKDPRHLVLLRNYNLKERPVSPISGAGHGTAPSAAQIPLSPLQSNDSPNTNQAAQNIVQPSQNQNAAFRNQAPQNIVSVHQPGAPPMAAPMSAGRPSFNPQINAPPNYHPSSMSARATHNWRMRPPGPPFIAPSAAPPASTPGSALLAQLNQPPSLGLNISPFGQRMDGNDIFIFLTIILIFIKSRSPERRIRSNTFFYFFSSYSVKIQKLQSDRWTAFIKGKHRCF